MARARARHGADHRARHLHRAGHAAARPKKFRGIGIRIEDDVVVTRDGCEVLTDGVPKDADEIEAADGVGSLTMSRLSMSPSSAAAWSVRASRWRCAARSCACCSSKASRRIRRRSRASTNAPLRSATARRQIFESLGRLAGDGGARRRRSAPFMCPTRGASASRGSMRASRASHAFGYVVPNRVIGTRVVGRRCGMRQTSRSRCRRSSRRATLRDEAVLLDVVIGAAQIEHDSARRSPWPPTVRSSVLRASAGIDAAVEDYDQVAIVVNAATETSQQRRGVRALHALGSAGGAAVRRAAVTPSCGR